MIVALGPAGGEGRCCSCRRVLDGASFSTDLLEARPRRRRTPGWRSCRTRAAAPGPSRPRSGAATGSGEQQRDLSLSRRVRQADTANCNRRSRAGRRWAGSEPAGGQDHANRSCVRKGSAARQRVAGHWADSTAAGTQAETKP